MYHNVFFLFAVMGKAEGQGENWHGHVTALTVAPEFRRLGLAGRLMQSLEEISERWVSWWNLISHFSLISLWRVLMMFLHEHQKYFWNSNPCNTCYSCYLFTLLVWWCLFLKSCFGFEFQFWYTRLYLNIGVIIFRKHRPNTKSCQPWVCLVYPMLSFSRWMSKTNHH